MCVCVYVCVVVDLYRFLIKYMTAAIETQWWYFGFNSKKVYMEWNK